MYGGFFPHSPLLAHSEQRELWSDLPKHSSGNAPYRAAQCQNSSRHPRFWYWSCQFKCSDFIRLRRYPLCHSCTERSASTLLRTFHSCVFGATKTGDEGNASESTARS